MAEDEVALDIEETNRLRAKLGLKPLNLASANAAKPKPQEVKEPKAADPEELRARVTAAREKRRRETELRQTKTLGEADEDVDDVANWIQKIKPGQPAAAEEPAAAAAKASKRQKRAAAGSDEEEYTAADLAGIAVKHDVDDLVEGETVVLTLADAGILDEKGNLAEGPDQLIDTLAQQEKARRKARAAATKTAKPLWEEDGKVRGLLDKYDEEEEEAVAAFDASGQLAQQKRQQELHSKLAAGAALLDGADSSSKAAAAAGDYYTPEEAAALKAGDKKKKKKRKLRTTKTEDEEGGGLDLDALEAAAAAAGAADLGSREAREARRQQQEQARAALVAEKAARFEAALGRANVASEALRSTAAGQSTADADEGDDELAASLARARRLAQKAAAAKNAGSSNGQGGDAEGAAAAGAAADGESGGLSFEEIARQLAQKREEDEARLKEQIASGAIEAFTETTEFVRSIQVEQPKAADEGSYMDVDDQPAATAAAAVPTPLPPPPAESQPAVKPPRQRNLRKGGWTTVDGEEEQQEGQGDAANGDHQQQHNRRPAPELEDTGVVGEKAMGKGLAATLALLKDKGVLKDKVRWSGRTNDKKPVALIGLHDVYTGGSHEDAMAQRIEVALTQKDEFGRVMTPKERFRVMCHQFHGMAPSKNKQEERQRKYLEEVALAQATSSENPSAHLDKLKELQKATGTAYIPLTGKLKPGAAAGGKDPLSGLASARTGTAATPVLGGGMTPLAGSKKVEMMLGISKGSGSMPPPAPRR